MFRSSMRRRWPDCWESELHGALPDIMSAVGNTPIVALPHFGQPNGHRLFGKCEFMNPGGSIKDRIAATMVRAAERKGELAPGGTIVEATAGNTGLALAMVAARRGYAFVCVTTDKVGPEKLVPIRAFGARVEVCDARLSASHPDHFVRVAQRLAASIPGGWHVNQFANPANTCAQRTGLGPEIWCQTRGEVDVLVAGMGTGGTMTGCGGYLKQQRHGIRLVLADPYGSILAAARAGDVPTPASYLVEGIGGNFVPGQADLTLIDAVETVDDREAVAAAHTLLRREGIFVGLASGCALAAARAFASRQGGPPLNVLVMLTDGGRGYLSTLYSRAWRLRHHVALEEDVCTYSRTG